MKSLCEFYTGNHFRNDTRLSVWDVGIFLIGRVWTMAGQSRMRACILIGTLSSNQKDVSPFPILKKKCSVEFQTIKAVFGTCPCANSQDHLDQFTVSFSSRQKFTFLFSRKLFEFGAYANSLDHSDCSHGVLAVFYENKFISESKFLSPPIKAVVRTCVCAISPDHSDFRLFMFGSHRFSKSG